MISVKRDTLVVLVNLILVLGAFALVWAGKISLREAGHFLVGLSLPTALVWRRRSISDSSSGSGQKVGAPPAIVVASDRTEDPEEPEDQEDTKK